jgi:tetratricopeptide (TPR) repeat protein
LLAACRALGASDAGTSTYVPSDAVFLAGQSLESADRLVPTIDATSRELALALSRPVTDPRRADELMRVGQRLLARSVRSTGDVAAAERSAALSAFEPIVRDHPTYARRDEALFDVGFLRHATGHDAEARQSYLALVRDAPSSRFVPNVFVLLAEAFIAQHQSDAAVQALDRALSTEPGDLPITGFAYYRRAWVERGAGHEHRAENDFAAAIDFVATHPSTPDARAIEQAARREICSTP